MTLPTMIAGVDRASTLEWCRRIDEGPWSTLAIGERIAYPNQELWVTLSAGVKSGLLESSTDAESSAARSRCVKPNSRSAKAGKTTGWISFFSSAYPGPSMCSAQVR